MTVSGRKQKSAYDKRADIHPIAVFENHLQVYLTEDT
jgi:hypothetical protein